VQLLKKIVTVSWSLPASYGVYDPVHMVHYVSKDRPLSALQISIADNSELNNPAFTVYPENTGDRSSGVPTANMRIEVPCTNMGHIHSTV